MRTSRGRAWILLLLAPTALLTTGCLFGGDSEDPTPTSTVARDTTPTPTSAPTAEPTPELQWPQVTTARITTEDLNVRSGPGTSNTVVGRLQPDSEVPVSGRWPGGRWLALTGLGWIAYDPEWVDLEVSIDELPEVSGDEAFFEFAGALHPPGTSADIPVVDQVAEAAVNGNRDALLRMVNFESSFERDDDANPGEATAEPTAPATDTPDPGSFTCSDRPLPAIALEAHIDEILESTVVPGARLQLYAVVRANFPAGYEPEENELPEFVAIFAYERGEAHQFWIDPAGGINAFSLRCEPTPPGELVQVTGNDPFFWFRPFTPSPLGPVE